MKLKQIKTGTTTVGVVCKDGIVLGADKRASEGYLIASKNVEKIHKITNDMVVTYAGLVSDAQLLTKLVRAHLKLLEVRTERKASVEEAANLLASMLYENIRRMSMVPSIVEFILGGYDENGFGLYILGIDGSIIKYDDYTSSGSGSVLAIGALESSYSKDITVKDGIKLVVKALNAAIQRDMPTGNGIDIVTVTKDGAKKVLTREIDTTIRI